MEKLDWLMTSVQVLVIFLILAHVPARNSKMRRFLRRFKFVRGPIIWLVEGYIFVALAIYAVAFLNYNLKNFNSEAIISTIITLGISLFLLRGSNQLIYGVLEIVAAIAGAMAAANAHQATEFQRLSALAAATYFIVRALVNIEEGWKKGCWPREWLSRFLSERLR